MLLASAAFSPIGAPYRIVERSKARGLFEMIICPTLEEEIRTALKKPDLRKRVSDDLAEQHIELIKAVAVRVDDPEDVRPVTRDPEDDYLVALALEHNLDYIVSGDKDLLVLNDLLESEEKKLRVLTPAGFVDIITSCADAPSGTD